MINNPYPNLDSSDTPVLYKMKFKQIKMDKLDSYNAYYQFRRNEYEHFPKSSVYRFWYKAKDTFYDFVEGGDEIYTVNPAKNVTREIVYLKFMMDGRMT